VGRLFWKFFLFSWLMQAVAVIGVGVFFRVEHQAREASLQRAATLALVRDASPGAQARINAAVQEIRQGRIMALQARIKADGPLSVYVVNAHQHELLRRPVEPGWLEQLQLLAADRNPAVREAVSPEGKRYWVFVPLDRKSPMDAAPGFGTHGPDGPDGPPPDMQEPPPDGAHRPPPGPGSRPQREPPRGEIFGHVPIEPILVGLIVSFLSAWLMAWYFAKPIRSLRNAFKLTAAGNLDFRLTPGMGRRRDELADLGRDFDLMTQKLQALMEGQRRLLHHVSHELRSPLARLQLAIGLAHQNPDKMQETLRRIELESERMENLVAELLRLSRLEAGFLGSVENVHMEELLAGLVEDARFEASSVDVSIIMAGHTDVAVKGNPELLRRALENVVRNAIKHSPAGAAVRIQARQQENQQKRAELVLTVCDQGPGVADENLQTIFYPFFREPTAEPQQQGHGLGLAIAKRVIDAHGGMIRAYNLIGGGLCMEIVLPLSTTTA
jgi:signal transduction histidine kinase